MKTSDKRGPYSRVVRALVVLLQIFVWAASSAVAAGPATFHYQPAEAIFGDAVPFFHAGVYHVYYLHQNVDAAGKLVGPMDWYHLASRDLVHWEELPPALRADANDRYIATGSIVEKDGFFHAFYSTAPVDDKGPGAASVRVATSPDLITWTKEGKSPLLQLKRDARSDMFDIANDWRDPHVFWNPHAKEWWMAVAAHEKLDPNYSYAGVDALVTSLDLRKWTVRPEPFLATREAYAGECPDVFPFGKGWALLYYVDATRIRVADTPSGPWRRPVNDVPWGLHFHAGKTQFDGKRRVITAFIPRVASDYMDDEYGGVMALPRELYLDDQGRPAVRLVPEVIAACSDDATGGRGVSVFKAPSKDPVSAKNNGLIFAPKTGQTALGTWVDAPRDFFLTTEVSLETDATLTLLLRGNTQKGHSRDQFLPLDDSYALTLDPLQGLVTLRRSDGWNRHPALRSQPIALPVNRPIKLHVMLHGDVLEAFVDDRISLSARVHLPTGALAFIARDGTVSLKDLRIVQLPNGN